jgi:hypothetical protein
MSVPMEQMPPSGGDQAAKPDKEALLKELNNLAPEIQLVVLTAKDAIDERGEELVQRAAQAAQSPAIAMSQLAFAIIMGAIAKVSAEAEAEVGVRAGINPGDFVGDSGPGELILAMLFGIAERMQLPGYDNVAEYATAEEALYMMLEIAEAGGEGDPNAAAPQAAPAPQEKGAANWRSQA